MTRFRVGSKTAALAALLGLIASPHKLWSQDLPLQITVVEGERAVHDTTRRIAAKTVVLVRDEGGRPASGAEVTFTVPEFGPSGKFADGGRSLEVRADNDGRAEMTGFTPNPFEGEFNIAVSARTSTAQGSLVLRQENARPSAPANVPLQNRPAGKAKKLLVVIGIGAVAAAASVLATGGGATGSGAPGSPVDPTNPPVTISIGSVAVGAPR